MVECTGCCEWYHSICVKVPQYVKVAFMSCDSNQCTKDIIHNTCYCQPAIYIRINCICELKHCGYIKIHYFVIDTN